MWAWLTDSLGKRLFLLMWGALAVAHVLAWSSVHFLYMRHQVDLPRFEWRSPDFPMPEPADDILDEMPRRGPMPAAGPGSGPGQGVERGPGPGGDRNLPPGPIGVPGMGPLPHGDFSLPAHIMALDYGVRLLVLALAAWFGSRWLARPMGKLADASQSLGEAIGQDGELPTVDEHSGTREVRQAAKVFNAMGRQLRGQFRSRALMVAAISHDLRTPLTRLRMRLECMDGEPELQQRSVADVREMNALIDNVLEVFRGTDPAHAEPLQKCDIAALAQSIVDDLAEQGHALSFAGEPCITQAQPLALRRVLGNLIGNALRYGKCAAVTVDQTPEAVHIRIDDQGPGIPDAHLEDVFQPFFRVEASRNQHSGGTGLGLYIARDLMQRQGGQVLLSNRPEGGLRAEIVLPRR